MTKKNMQLGLRLSALIGTAILACSGQSAVAQTSPPAGPAPPEGDDSDVIVVTASRMGETDIQRTPLAISAFSNQQIERQVIIDVHDLVQVAPNLAVAQNSGFAQIYLRGIGTNAPLLGADPSVSVQVDGVYIARPYAQFTDFMDVQRVEVLRGPQGTLYGRNAIGGTINIITRTPSDELQASGEIRVGNANLISVGAYLSGPIVPERVAIGVSMGYTHHDPYIRNIIPGVPGVSSADRGALRVQLVANLTDDIRAITRVSFTDENDSIAPFAVALQSSTPEINSILGRFDRVAMNRPTTTINRTRTLSEEVSFQVTPDLMLRSITAFNHMFTNQNIDSDGTNLDILYTRLSESSDTFSQELNLTGEVGPLSFIAGLYYLEEDASANTQSRAIAAGVNVLFLPTLTSDARAVFAQGDWHVTDRLTLTAGVRYTRENKSFNQNLIRTFLATGAQLPGSPVIYSLERTFDAVTPKFGISYTLPNAMFYASLTRGFKSGGFNLSSGTALQGYDPEFLWSYEAGIRTTFFNRRLKVNLTGFYYDYTDLQVLAFIAPAVSDITNAANARVRGLELEVEARPAPHFTIGGNLALLDTEYREYIGPGNVNFSGNRLNSAPPYTLNLFAEYGIRTARGLISARGQYSRNGLQYFTAANDRLQSQESYGLVNAFLTYEDDHGWSIGLWGKNLSGTDYVTNTNTTVGIALGHPGEPRTFGLRFSWAL